MAIEMEVRKRQIIETGTHEGGGGEAILPFDFPTTSCDTPGLVDTGDLERLANWTEVPPKEELIVEAAGPAPAKLTLGVVGLLVARLAPSMTGMFGRGSRMGGAVWGSDDNAALVPGGDDIFQKFARSLSNVTTRSL